jgi:hypothetical protein
MVDQPRPRRSLSEVFADMEALPLSRDPFEQMQQMKDLNRLLQEAGLDAGPDSRDEEIAQHPDSARVLLGIIDRMLPVFDDPECAWAEQPNTRHLFPRDYYQVEDPIQFFLLGEYLPNLPGFARALTDLVKRNPQAWSVEQLLHVLVPSTPVGSADRVHLDAVIDRLEQVERPVCVRRMVREFVESRQPPNGPSGQKRDQ